MTAWAPDRIGRIGDADDLHVAPFRPDGRTPGTPTWIWSVVVDGRLYARAWNGVRSRWYRAAITQGAGRISTAGETIEVVFARADDGVRGRVDDAYRRKYAGSGYLPPMVSPGPQAATVEIIPRGVNVTEKENAR